MRAMAGNLKGSSPHTRGARTCMADTPEEDGIIPAYAGSTGTLRLLYIQSRDHPRIRGEHVFREVRLRLQSGSSPHTRGALQDPTEPSQENRIIPAYAGSTRRCR